jgi:hypothetical protein
MGGVGNSDNGQMTALLKLVLLITYDVSSSWNIMCYYPEGRCLKDVCEATRKVTGGSQDER